MNDCPCNGCPDRSGDPNCHSEDGAYCSHGYIQWRDEQRVKKAKFAAELKIADDISGAKIRSLGVVKKRKHLP